MSGMNIAVFYLDPNKNSAKLTQATARDLNLIAPIILQEQHNKNK